MANAQDIQIAPTFMTQVNEAHSRKSEDVLNRQGEVVRNRKEKARIEDPHEVPVTDVPKAKDVPEKEKEKERTEVEAVTDHVQVAEVPVLPLGDPPVKVADTVKGVAGVVGVVVDHHVTVLDEEF